MLSTSCKDAFMLFDTIFPPPPHIYGGGKLISVNFAWSSTVVAELASVHISKI